MWEANGSRRFLQPAGLTPAYQRLLRNAQLMLECGLPKNAVEAYIERKIHADLALEKAKRLQPSDN